MSEERTAEISTPTLWATVECEPHLPSRREARLELQMLIARIAALEQEREDAQPHILAALELVKESAYNEDLDESDPDSWWVVANGLRALDTEEGK